MKRALFLCLYVRQQVCLSACLSVCHNPSVIRLTKVVWLNVSEKEKNIIDT